MSAQNLDPASRARLDVALARGYIDAQQAAEAERIHAQILALGLKPKPIEEILAERGIIDPTRQLELSMITALPVAPAPTPIVAAEEPRRGPTDTARINLGMAPIAPASETSGATRIEAGRENEDEGVPVEELAGFRLERRIGAGSNGVVYKAIQLSMKRAVALKILYQRLAKNKAYVERFLREARVAARLNHPNIIGGIDVGEEKGYYFFAMEFADGRTVRELLDRGGAVDERQALAIVRDTARALDHASKHGLIHRDIKPDNIVITTSRIVKLLDLGLAREAGEVAAEAGKAFGTPNYISPEQARGEASIDTRSDIYSLGATLYHMLSGQTPFQGNPAVVMAKHVSEQPAPLATLVKGLSAATIELVETMMAKRPEDRHQTPQELIDHVEGVLARLDPGRAAPSRPGAPPRPRRRPRLR